MQARKRLGSMEGGRDRDLGYVEEDVEVVVMKSHERDASVEGGVVLSQRQAKFTGGASKFTVAMGEPLAGRAPISWPKLPK